MTFYINEIILWLSDKKIRRIAFKENKINVITGESHTGKSAILQIIDYVFFASKSHIPESRINENVEWYGVNFSIQDKNYTLARSSLIEGKVTYEYYFSSSGNVPKFPENNNDEQTLKSLIETEFGIDRNVKIPFGGRFLKSGTKISFRYFFMFSTISEDIITNSNVFFDKQGEVSYREAIHRIFDLAVGIDDVENILKREKLNSLETELKQLKRKQDLISGRKAEFINELNDVIRKSKEFGLIAETLESDEAIIALQEVIDNLSLSVQADTVGEYESLKKEEYRINRIIRNLQGLGRDYSAYKSTLDQTVDSLKPIEYLQEKKHEIVATSIFFELLQALQADLLTLKSDTKKRVPIDTNVSDLIYEHQSKLDSVKQRMDSLPQSVQSFESEREKHFFLGQTKTKLDLYNIKKQSTKYDYKEAIDSIEEEIGNIHLVNVEDKRQMFIKFLEEIFKKYIKESGDALANYKEYLPVFDYTNKKISLRKPLTDFIDFVGSSSNHMFMHLIFFLGLHEAIQRKKSRFVPPFLIIDQPSRPYWGDTEEEKNELESSDETKIRKAFELLNGFIETMVSELKTTSQIIVFEHVPPKIWSGLDHVHLVDTFSDGNALIPKSYLESTDD